MRPELRRVAVCALVLAAAATSPAAALGETARTAVLYASDWLGPTQIFAVDATQKKPLGQVTFQHLPPCSAGQYPITCGFIDPLPSPDGRHLLFRSNGVNQSALWVANGDGSNSHVIVSNLPFADPGPGHLTVAWSKDSRRIRYGDKALHIDGSSAPCCTGRWQLTQRDYHGYDESVVSPNGRWVAFTDKNGISVTNRRTSQTRVLTGEGGFNLVWSPDSKSVAYISGFMHYGTARTGDLRIVTLSGAVRTVVRRGSAYGGEIVSVAWAQIPRKLKYRRPAAANGLYAGGEVARLAADGANVAFASCFGVYAWRPPAAAPTVVQGNTWGGGLCFPPTDRVQVYDLALAGDRMAYGRTSGGLTPLMELWVSSLSNPAPVVVARGSTQVGGHVRGVGTLAGSGDMLVYSDWDGRPAGGPSADAIVSGQSIYRIDGTSCPCPAIRSVPALGTPVDVDASRVVVLHAFWPDGTWTSRTPSLAVLDRTGSQRLSLPVDAAAAELAGNELVAAVGGSLNDYDAVTGVLRHSWPVANETPARDCLFWAGPECVGFVYAEPPHYVLQDAARGLAAYTLDGRLHVLRLSDGKDSVVGFAGEARFMDSGLAYADGSRVHLAPFMTLP
jgi:hypothetical protein